MTRGWVLYIESGGTPGYQSSNYSLEDDKMLAE